MIALQSEVWICMEQMSTCLDKLIKKLKEPIPEQIIGKMVVSVRLYMPIYDSLFLFVFEACFNSLMSFLRMAQMLIKSKFTLINYFWMKKG